MVTHSVDRELVARWMVYCRRPRMRPMRDYYALWGYHLSRFL